MKKIIALVLALAMVALCIGAAVADTETKTGSITISNAAKGETYTIYKLFDATVDATDSTKIAYYGSIPAGLTDYFEETQTGSGYVQAKDAAWKDASTKAEMSDGLKTALTTWANAQTSNAGTAVADGSAVVFNSLALGYYVVTTSQGEQAISVDSTNLNVSIVDKNTTEITADKVVNGTSYNIGDTITYTATFDTTNYIGDKQVKSYTISDTLPEFLSDVAITSLTIVQSTDNKTAYPDVDLSSSYTSFTNKQIIIPWVTGDNDDSLYKNGSQIVLVYTAKLTSTSKVGGADNTNTVKIQPNKDKPGEDPFEEYEDDDAIIKTYGAALQKQDDAGYPLAGAKFAFKGLTVESTDVDGVYRVTAYDKDSPTLGTVMDTDSNGKLYILGLKEGAALKGNETEAPLGYNKLTDEVTVNAQVMSTEIWHKAETRYYDPKGNLTSTVTTTSQTKTGDETNLDVLETTAITTVTNHKGTELPSTGGIGTTIFYIVGGLLLVGAAVVLVARRKAEN